MKFHLSSHSCRVTTGVAYHITSVLVPQTTKVSKAMSAYPGGASGFSA